MPDNLAVVIPHYQVDRGILRAAVTSVLSQAVPKSAKVTIVVVDDGSPLPAERDLQGLEVAAPFELTIMLKSNGGVASARNRGLKVIDCEEVKYVAFLDSDDVWVGDHLLEAVAAIDAGADFYFCNSMHDEVSSFSYFRYMRENYGPTPDASSILSVLDSSEAFAMIVDECVPHTSNVVYNFRAHSKVRFEESLQRTGEDQLFWLHLAYGSNKVAYSTAIRGRRGEGVSIYRHSLGWDTPNILNRLVDGLLFRSLLVRQFMLDPALIAVNKARQRETLDQFAFLALRNLFRSPLSVLRALARFLRETPEYLPDVPLALLRIPSFRRDVQIRAEAGLSK